MDAKKRKKILAMLLDLFLEIDEETVKEWIHKIWPHGIGLYE